MLLYNPILLQILLLLAGIVLAYLLYNRLTRRKRQVEEGFQQDERFVLKTGNDVYDDFYGEIYDKLMLPKDRIRYEMVDILQTVSPSIDHSVMLDVGTGTGELVAYLREHGYTAYGVDKSQAMVNIAHTKVASSENINVIKCANAEDPMTYDRSLFSHIFCMNFTIYEIDNKSKFFENCHYWLRNNGYLIIHLADKDSFNTIIPAGKPENVPQGKRIKNTFIDFADFTYKSEFSEGKENKIVHKETFTDKSTQNVRQNERTMRMESMVEIIDMARMAGFIVKGEFTMENGPSKDKSQKVCILERIA